LKTSRLGPTVQPRGEGRNPPDRRTPPGEDGAGALVAAVRVWLGRSVPRTPPAR